MGILDRRLPPRARPVGHVDPGSPSAEAPAEPVDDFDTKLAELKAKLDALKAPAADAGAESEEAADAEAPAAPAKIPHRWRLYVSGSPADRGNRVPAERPMDESEFRSPRGLLGGFFFTETPGSAIADDSPLYALHVATMCDRDDDIDHAAREFAGRFARFWGEAGGLTVTGEPRLVRALLAVAIEWAPQIPVFPCDELAAIAIELLAQAPRRERQAYETAWHTWHSRGA